MIIGLILIAILVVVLVVVLFRKARRALTTPDWGYWHRSRFCKVCGALWGRDRKTYLCGDCGHEAGGFELVCRMGGAAVGPYLVQFRTHKDFDRFHATRARRYRAGSNHHQRLPVRPPPGFGSLIRRVRKNPES